MQLASLHFNRRDSGFTLIEVLMMILLMILIASLVSKSFYNKTIKHKIDQTIYLSQSIVFAAQNYYSIKSKWPGIPNEDEEQSIRCRKAILDLEKSNSRFIGDIEGPTELDGNIWKNPLGLDLKVRCAHNNVLTNDKLWIRQCIPKNWVSYLVNALANTRATGSDRCGEDLTEVETEIPQPGNEPSINGAEEILANGSLTKHNCPIGLNHSVYFSAPSGFKSLKDDENLLGMVWRVAENSESSQFSLKQHAWVKEETDSEVDEPAVWIELDSDDDCGDGKCNRAWVRRVCI